MKDGRQRRVEGAGKDELEASAIDVKEGRTGKMTGKGQIRRLAK